MKKKSARILSSIVAIAFLMTSVFTLNIVQAATVKLTAKVKTSTSVTLTWSYVRGFAGYRVYRSVYKTKSYKLISTVKVRTYLSKGLTTNKTYYFKIRPYKLKGKTRIYGSYSNIAYAKPIVKRTPTPTPIKTPTPTPTGHTKPDSFTNTDELDGLQKDECDPDDWRRNGSKPCHSNTNCLRCAG